HANASNTQDVPAVEPARRIAIIVAQVLDSKPLDRIRTGHRVGKPDHVPQARQRPRSVDDDAGVPAAADHYKVLRGLHQADGLILLMGGFGGCQPFNISTILGPLRPSPNGEGALFAFALKSADSAALS